MADISSKSANYCQPGMSGNTGLLLLCEAELGKTMYEIPTGNSMAEEECKKKGCISTLGVGRTAPQGWTDGGFIHESLKGVRLVSGLFWLICVELTKSCSLMSRKALETTRRPMQMDT